MGVWVPRPRWIKLVRDVAAERERLALMLVAIAVSLAAVGAVLGGYAVLTREIAANYLGTHPADATLELPGGVDARALAIAREHPSVREAEAREVLLARAQVSGDWRPLLLFVVDDFSAMKLNAFTPLAGEWPPALGSMLVERKAVPMLNADIGGTVLVKTPHAAAREVKVSGLVHDPGLAPAWQERSGYGYVTRATLAALGEAPVLHELRISLKNPAAGIAEIEAVAADLARRLKAQGREVHEIRVPPPRLHPHQRQMSTLLLLMLAFALMAVVLSAVVVSSSLAAMLARQVREIGIMKAVGARACQIVLLYAALVAALGAAAVVLAVPAGLAGARLLAQAVSGNLNFAIADGAVPYWVLAVQAAAGIVVPLIVAAGPIVRAGRTTVREAIGQHGASSERLRERAAALPWPVRNALRRPARLALTAGLLAAGGAMFMTALNVSRSWERNIAKVYERATTLSCRDLFPASSPQLASAQVVGWIPATSAGMTSYEASESQH